MGLCIFSCFRWECLLIGECMTVKEILIGSTGLVLDSVTLDVDLQDAARISIQDHPEGPCLVCHPARARITGEQATLLINAGVADRRRHR
jgi:hypothetical protein